MARDEKRRVPQIMARGVLVLILEENLVGNGVERTAKDNIREVQNS